MVSQCKLFLKKKENWWKGSENIWTLGIGVNIRKGERTG